MEKNWGDTPSATLKKYMFPSTLCDKFGVN